MASVSQLLLLLLCSYHSLRAADAHSIRKVLATGSLKAEAVCAEPQVTPSSSSGRVTVPLNHRYGPCSPTPSTNEPTMAELLRGDQLRAEYVRRKVFGVDDELKQSELSVPTTLGSAMGTPLYFITVSIGSPAVRQNMVIDTGSDVSWVQCNPCPEPSCHAPNGSLFDPLQSSTYVPFNCTSAACLQLSSKNLGCGTSSQECRYGIVYGDASNTTGTYGSDTLALADNVTVSDFQFGCSHEESDNSDKTDGLMGLGGGVQSLVSQTAATHGNSFSYCLPANSSTSGFLTLGTPDDTSDFVTTRMLRVKQRTFYNVLLQDIRVDGKLLGIAPSVFANESLMDSGTRITTLPLKAYSALSSAFKASMTQYTEAPPRGVFDTCFNFTGVEEDNLTIPPVALVFDGGAIVDLHRSGIIDMTRTSSCLAFYATTESDGSIIGNVQQRTFEVLHDVGQSVFGFRKAAC